MNRSSQSRGINPSQACVCVILQNDTATDHKVSLRGAQTHLEDPEAAVGELGGDASLPSSACIAFRDWRASAKLVLSLAEELDDVCRAPNQLVYLGISQFCTRSRVLVLNLKVSPTD